MNGTEDLPERLAQLLDAIRTQGGDWGPNRARDAYWELGFECTAGRGYANMQRLAELGYLVPVRPGAHTFRLKEGHA